MKKTDTDGASQFFDKQHEPPIPAKVKLSIDIAKHQIITALTGDQMEAWISENLTTALASFDMEGEIQRGLNRHLKEAVDLAMSEVLRSPEFHVKIKGMVTKACSNLGDPK
jgi:hypothetical protein